MKHLCELPIPTIRAILEEKWKVTEKLDGSFIRAGLDDNGIFYTERKGNSRYYHVDDWPDLPWTNSFRSAHLALECVFDALSENDYTGKYVDIEVIAGELPNSIRYNLFEANNLWITGGTALMIQARLNNRNLFQFNGNQSQLGLIKVSSNVWKTKNGIDMFKERKDIAWSLRAVQPTLFDPKIRFDGRDLNLRNWLERRVDFRGQPTNNGDILDAKLNRKPEFVEDYDWIENRKTVIAELKVKRESLRGEFEKLCNVTARMLKTWFLHQEYHEFKKRKVSPADIEGVVVTVLMDDDREIVFKVVDKELFAPLNNFTHIVRYWLQGGRRPERPSFWTRTAHWPMQKRLDRLEQLRRRYQVSKYSLKHVADIRPLSYANWELDERTLLLFAELKQRIQNGWGSIQGQSSSDQ